MVLEVLQVFGAPMPFNSSLEVGVRLLILLNSFYPKRLQLTELALYDYFIIHTADADGPPSIHPSIPSRHGEYFIRRGRIESGLTLMRNAHMVHYHSEPIGTTYEASEKASALIDTMMTPYNLKLRDRAEWLSSECRCNNLFQIKLLKLINELDLESEKGLG